MAKKIIKVENISNYIKAKQTLLDLHCKNINGIMHCNFEGKWVPYLDVKQTINPEMELKKITNKYGVDLDGRHI
jgi:hypothetical protein